MLLHLPLLLALRPRVTQLAIAATACAYFASPLPVLLPLLRLVFSGVKDSGDDDDDDGVDDNDDVDDNEHNQVYDQSENTCARMKYFDV